MTIDPGANYFATIRTNMGTFVIELFPTAAPITVNNFVFLARDGFYDDVIFHRVIENFMIQGGDPTGTGRGGPGYNFKDEIDLSLDFDRPGILAMANAGPNTNGSQFFITVVPTLHLNGAHTIFGQVLEAQGIVETISKLPGDANNRPTQTVTIHSIEITKTSSIHLKSLSSSRAGPGELLTLTGSGFDLDAATFVVFTDPAGKETRVRSTSVTATTVDVAVPVFLNVEEFRIQAGTMSVAVVQESPGSITVSETVDDFRIADLPQTGLPPGTVTLEVLDQIQQLLGSTARAWQGIEDASLDSVDTLALRTNLLAVQEQVLAAQIPIQQLVDGEVQEVELGELSGQRVFLNLDALQVLDRMYVAYLLSDRNRDRAGTQSPLEGIMAYASLADGHGETANEMIGCPQGIQKCIRDEYNLSLAQTMQELLDKFNKFRGGAEAAIGVAEKAANNLGIPEELINEAKTNAGAILYYTTTLAPSVMGASMFSLAAPFIQLEGVNLNTEQVYQVFSTHLDKGSKEFLKNYDEGVIGKILRGLGRVNELENKMNAMVDGAQSLLRSVDLSSPESAPRQAFANSETIFARSPAREIPIPATSTPTPLPPTPTLLPPTPTPLPPTPTPQGPLAFSAGALPDATQLEYFIYSYCVPEPVFVGSCGGGPQSTATGGTPPYIFRAIGLPNGLSLDGNGVLDGSLTLGTPTGPQRFDICVIDQDGTKVCQEAEIYVNPPPPGYRLYINGLEVPAGKDTIFIPNGKVLLNPPPYSDGTYPPNWIVEVSVEPYDSGSKATLDGVEIPLSPVSIDVFMNLDKYLSLSISPFDATPTPPPTPTPASPAVTWSGSYNVSSVGDGGCTYNSGGTLSMTIAESGNSFSGTAYSDGIQLRYIPSCDLAYYVSSSGTVSGTISGDNWDVTFIFSTEAGTQASGGTAILSGNTLSGEFLRLGRSITDGSFTLTRQ